MQVGRPVAAAMTQAVPTVTERAATVRREQ